MAEIDDALIVAQGRQRTVAFALAPDGSCPAREFLDGNDLPEKDRLALAHAFKLIADQGKVSSKQRFKKLTGDIWEFKSHQARISCFWDPNLRGVLRLGPGFIKKTHNWPKPELKRAKQFFSEFVESSKGEK